MPIIPSIPLPMASLTRHRLTTSAHRQRVSHSGLSREGSDVSPDTRSFSSSNVSSPVFSSNSARPSIRLLAARELLRDRVRAGSGAGGMYVRYKTDRMSWYPQDGQLSIISWLEHNIPGNSSDVDAAARPIQSARTSHLALLVSASVAYLSPSARYRESSRLTSELTYGVRYE